LTFRGGGGSSQVLSIVKVLAIDLTFASISDLLKDGMAFCGKVAVKNKDMFAFDLFFLLGGVNKFFGTYLLPCFYLKTQKKSFSNF
jgi:hypothetical protein